MTTLREAAQQALEILERLHGGCTDSDDGTVEAITIWVPEIIDALKAALAEPETCTWQQDGDSDSGSYGTSCRRYFNLEDGTPEDNKMAWCCYCGRKLTQALITEDRDE